MNGTSGSSRERHPSTSTTIGVTPRYGARVVPSSRVVPERLKHNTSSNPSGFISAVAKGESYPVDKVPSRR
jgi:hypothetical protein